jgi:hypothetical protein
MTQKTQKSKPRNLIPILIAAVGLAVVCMIIICVLLILLVLPAVGVEVPNPFAAGPDATQESSLTPGETPSVEADTPLEPPVDDSYDRALEMAGEWRGMWINNTFASTGAARLLIEVDPSGMATLTFDLDGYVFGLFDPDPITYTANFGGGRIDFDVSDDPVFGDFLASGLADGTVSIEAELIPVEGIATLFAEGTFTPLEIHLTYTVEFIGGGEAMGELDLTKEP